MLRFILPIARKWKLTGELTVLDSESRLELVVLIYAFKGYLGPNAFDSRERANMGALCLLVRSYMRT